MLRNIFTLLMKTLSIILGVTFICLNLDTTVSVFIDIYILVIEQITLYLLNNWIS